MSLVFLLEERSMAVFLEGLLPRLLPPGLHYRLIPHEGCSDLERSIPRKLRAWQEPGARFVIVRDQDRGDCIEVKERLRRLCHEAGRGEDALIRIACRELEAWYLADLKAIDFAYQTRLERLQAKVKFRDPDRLGSPSRELSRLVPEFSKVNGARRLGPLLDVGNERSRSFAVFVRGVLDMARAGSSGER